MARYIVSGAVSHACCFVASVLDASQSRDEDGVISHPMICECQDDAIAQAIADSMNITDGIETHKNGVN